MGVTSETITSYYDPSNTGYGTANVLSSSTFNAGNVANCSTAGSLLACQSSQTALENIANLSAPFSETEVITASFAAGSDTLTSNALIEAGATAPEPASCALIGAGLLGVALIRRRRRSTN